jgi:hypothetical protein
MSDVITAIKIQTAVKDALFGEDSHPYAVEIAQLVGGDDEILHALFRYASALSSDVAYRVTEILMSESELKAMANDLEFYHNLEHEVMGE